METQVLMGDNKDKFYVKVSHLYRYIIGFLSYVKDIEIF